MVEKQSWHVRSNGLNYVIRDQHANVIAEFTTETGALWVAAMFNAVHGGVSAAKLASISPEFRDPKWQIGTKFSKRAFTSEQSERIGRIDDVVSALKTILKRGYHIEVSDYETATKAIEALEQFWY